LLTDWGPVDELICKHFDFNMPLCCHPKAMELIELPVVDRGSDEGRDAYEHCYLTQFPYRYSADHNSGHIAVEKL